VNEASTLDALATPVSVVCAGVIVADHLCTPIDHVPAAGELVQAEELVLNLGGCASNAAVVLAKLGVRAAIVGKVGDDVFGRFATQELAARGVDTQGVSVDPSRATSQSLIVNVTGQDRRFIHSFGANSGFEAADLDAPLTRGPRVVYVGGYLILPSLDPDALAERFTRARQAGAMTVLDVATPGPADYLSRLRAVLPVVDVFLPNTDEATLILGEADPVRQALAFRDLGAKRVVVTRGERGAVAVSDTLRATLGIYSVPAIDATGGGDAFDAGYIAGLIEGRSEFECLQLASAVGASCVRAVGATTGIFNRAEAEEFIQARDLPINPF
jgi:sugar/nucleoside kinase (ribokinase family)